MSDEKNIAQQKFDRELEEFLRDDDSRLAALYRKLPQPEPDAQLDARVRALAQRAAREPSSSAATAAQIAVRRHSNRLPAIGAAAAFVLAAGIAWRVAPQIWPARNEVAAPAAETTSVAAPAAERAAAPAPSAAGKPGAPAADSMASNAPAIADAFPAKSLALPAPPRQTKLEGAPSTAGALSRRESPMAATAARAKAIEAPAQAFPAAPAPAREPARDKLEKVENAASEPIAAPLAAPAPAANITRIDENERKQRAGDQFAAQQGLQHENAAKSAPAAALQGAPAAVAQLKCPIPLRGKDWQGTYPPDIPPSDELRFAYVLRLQQQGHRESALKAYTDFHEHCPSDQWRRDLLDQLGVK